MVAHIGRVVAGAAESRNARDAEIVVEARNSDDVDVGIVEHILAARDRLAFGGVLVPMQAEPRPIQVKDLRGEQIPVWILSQGIVYADEEIRQ